MKGKVLVTGGCGFIGSNLLTNLLENYPELTVLNLDLLTYAGKLENVEHLNKYKKRYHFIKGNICDPALLKKIFSEHQIDGVIHLAAESHVDNSLERPGDFIQTNVQGTLELLQAAWKAWFSEPFSPKKGCEKNCFLHISTDEVYGSLGEDGLFSESTPYAPNSPYSASKAASDFLVRAWYQSYGLNVVTLNSSNNYGPRQDHEKLVPTILWRAMQGEDIPVYGDGKNVRDWLYVEDHCSAIILAYKKGEPGETYAVGGRNERDNNQVVTAICDILDEIFPACQNDKFNGDSYRELITYVKDRPGHDYRYAVDPAKIEKGLGWETTESFESGIQKTVKWYLEKYREEKYV